MNKLLLLSAVLLLLGCGGSSENDGGAFSSASGGTGVFLDSPVAGVQYRVFFNDGNVGDIKVTDSKGRFSYEGDTFAISFFLGRDPVGRINLGSSTIKPTITLLDLLPKGEVRTVDHPKISAMAQLLQSLDDDGDITSTIHISSQTLAKINEMSDNSDTALIDLDSDPASKIVQVLEMIQATENLVPFSNAEQHLEQSLEEIQTNEQNPLAPYNVVAARSDASLTFFWQGTANTDSYDLYITRGTGLTNQHYEDFATSKHSDVTSPYTITDLTNGATYSYFIVAINDIGEQPSVVKQAVPMDLLNKEYRRLKREAYNQIIGWAKEKGEDYKQYCSFPMLVFHDELDLANKKALDSDIKNIVASYDSMPTIIHPITMAPRIPYDIWNGQYFDRGERREPVRNAYSFIRANFEHPNRYKLPRLPSQDNSLHIPVDMTALRWIVLDERVRLSPLSYGYGYRVPLITLQIRQPLNGPQPEPCNS